MCVTVSVREAFLASLLALVNAQEADTDQFHIGKADILNVCATVYKNEGFLITTGGILQCVDAYGYNWATVKDNIVSIPKTNRACLEANASGTVSSIILNKFLSAVKQESW